ncbi:MAG TPA: STAS domain-containing protein [Bacteroidales bacterium]|nr:STAS domain-containing protein [Bacteroidales bacterium]
MLRVEQYNNTYKLSFKETDKFNVYNAKEVENELMEYVKEPRARVTLNLNGVNSIDSSAFESLLRVLRNAKINDTQFQLTNITEDAMELIKVMQLENVFNIKTNGY